MSSKENTAKIVIVSFMDCVYVMVLMWVLGV